MLFRSWEKAGIAKSGVPLVTMDYPRAMAARIEGAAAEACAEWLPRKGQWDAATYQGKLHYRDRGGKLSVPLPKLPGAHQANNAALAIAMLRHQRATPIPDAALRALTGWAEWPARLQRLAPGPLIGDRTVWLDGGHNVDGGKAIAAHFTGQKIHLITGILANKDARGLLEPFKKLAGTFTPLPVPNHPHHSPEALAEIATELGMKVIPATTPEAAIAAAPEGTILILGSLYLAGEVLRLNHQMPH